MEKNLECVICGEEFRNKHILQFHMEKCGNSDDNEQDSTKNQVVEGKERIEVDRISLILSSICFLVSPMRSYSSKTHSEPAPEDSYR